MKRIFTILGYLVASGFKRVQIALLLFGVVFSYTVFAQSKPASGGMKENNKAVSANNKGKEDHVPHLTSKWIAQPFDHKLFIENKGQFDSDANGQKVLFEAYLGSLYHAYFTPNGVYFKQTHFIKDPTDKDDEDEVEKDAGKNAKVDMSKPHRNTHMTGADDPDVKHIAIVHTTQSIWEGASPQVTIEAEDQESYPTSYGVLHGKEVVTVSASSFKKITYKNMYPGIDISYSYPEGDKTGLKYVIIVHPGADLSQVKLNYTDAKGMKIEPNGDLTIQNEITDFTDHAPVSSLQESGNNVNVNYAVKGSTESFEVKGGYDKTKTLVIDPWTYTGTFGFTNYGEVYDIDYDNYGNAYAEGDYGPYQIVKFSSTGAILWKHKCFTWDNTNGGYNGQTIYGDFATDKHSSVCYIGEGFNATGADCEKLSPNNVLLATYTGTTVFQEMWRMEYNNCTTNIVIAGGGTNTPATSEVAILDTTLAVGSITSYNPMNANKPGHDAALMTQDPNGQTVYMEFVESSYQTNVDPNYLMSCQATSAGFAPGAYNYIKPTGYGFQELESIGYVGPGGYSGGATTNGMNGLAAGPGELYMYDGGFLSEWNKATGAQVGGYVTINGGNYEYYQGGLAADGCNNVYVGDNGQVDIYNSSLGFLTSASVKNTVYALKLGANDQTLYAGGAGFLQAFNNPFASVVAAVSTYSNTTCGLPNGSATASLSLCSGPAVGVNYSWSPGGQTTQTATNLASGTYTVTMVVGCGDKYTASVTIGSSTIPTLGIAAAPSATICDGSSATLTASGGTGTSYTWSTGASNTASISVSPTTTTTYTVTDAACATYSTSITVNVNPTPPAPTAGSNSPICAGQNVTFTATATGATGYNWGGPNSFSSTTQNPTITAATAADAGTYTVTATQGACTGPATTVTVVINPTPTATVGSSIPSDSICSGGPITLTASGAGAGGGYSWNTTPVQTTAAITVSPATTTTYVVTETTALGCSNGPTATDTVVVHVTATPTITVGPSANPSICPGDSVHLYATGATTYSWAPGGQTTDSIWVKPAINSSYTVTAANGKCSAGAGTVVTVNVGTLTVGIHSSGGTTVCSGVPDTLTATGGAPLLVWSTGATTSSVIITPVPTDTTISIKATSGSCSAYDTITIAVNVTPTVVSVNVNDSSASVCPGDTTQAYVIATGSTSYTYNWSSTPPQVGDTAYGLPAGTYSVTVTAANGCSALSSNTVTIKTQNIVVTATASGGGSICTGGSPTLLTGSGANNYVWHTSPGLADTIYDTATAFPATTTTYTLMGTTTGTCKDSTTITVTVNQTPTIVLNVSRDTAVCTGGSITMKASGASGGYVWLPATYLNPSSGTSATEVSTPTAPITYTVTGKGAGGCSATDTVTVNVVPSPTVTISASGGNDTVCNGKSVTLTASGAGGNTYLWSPGGSTNASIKVTPTTSPETYTVESTNAGCSLKTTQDVYIFPALNIAMLPTIAGCSGQPVTIGAIVSGGDPLPGYTYSWTPNVGTGSGPYTVSSSAQTYTCMVTDGCNNTVQDTTQVTVSPTPVACFVPMPADSVLAGGYISFVNCSNNSASSSAKWYWTFGDGGSAVDSFPYYQYNVAGTYTVTLYDTTAGGCGDTVSHTVIVKQWIFVPNVFTPNGDGINDVFHVTAASMKTYSIEIFNRWGERVFSADSPQIDWNGRSQSGVMCSDGTYYYKILATDYAGHNYNLDGYLQLIGGGNVGSGQ